MLPVVVVVVVVVVLVVVVVVVVGFVTVLVDVTVCRGAVTEMPSVEEVDLAVATVF